MGAVECPDDISVKNVGTVGLFFDSNILSVVAHEMRKVFSEIFNRLDNGQTCRNPQQFLVFLAVKGKDAVFHFDLHNL